MSRGRLPLCFHPSYGIVTHKAESLRERIFGPRTWYDLRCYRCRKTLPFFFYTKKEWDELEDSPYGT